MRKQGEFLPTSPDAEEIELDDSFWQHAKVMPPMFPRKASVHLRLDHDVLDWFKKHGKGHLTRMNTVLRAYVYAELNKAFRANVRAEAKRPPAAKSRVARVKSPKKASHA
jgi:uncharacterized protein (DUF4415 family)